MKCKVAKRREELGLPVVVLAAACKVSRQTIHSIENGTFKPTILLALKLALALDVKVEDLFLLEKDDL